MKNPFPKFIKPAKCVCSLRVHTFPQQIGQQ